MSDLITRFAALACVSFSLLCASGCGGTNDDSSGKPPSNGASIGEGDSGAPNQQGSAAAGRFLRLPIPSDGPKSMDPVQGSTQYDNICSSQVYEPLLQFKYLVRPLQLEPLLLAQMPTVSEDGLTYRFELKPDVYFHDDACFEGGKGRKLAPQDFIYSIKRLLDKDISQKNAWVVRDKIKGLDDYAAAQNAAERFDYDQPVAGMRVIDDVRFEIELIEPVQSFLWSLSMFQTSVVPREAVEQYGIRFGRHPVGTGPFTMREDAWKPNESMTLVRNPKYHESFYPSESMPADTERGFEKDAGKRLPLSDGIVYRFFVEDQPMWLQFQSGNLDFSRVPRDNFDQAYNKRTKKLRSEFSDRGILDTPVPLLDFIFYGFNMEDELLGGYTQEKRDLRRAIALAIDWDERNDVIYDNICQIYDGMIPPGLDGFPTDGRMENASRGPQLQRARELLAKAGYPDGKNLPTIDCYSSIEGTGKESAELTTRQLKKIGVNINSRLDVFSTFMESIDNGKAAMFMFSWGSDYPDAENNLALFYGPNKSPGANHYNYQNDEYDRLYEQIRTMQSSPERTELYKKMRDMVVDDVVFAGSLARTRYYLAQPWLRNFKPEETFFNWPKYLALEPNGGRP